MSILFGIRNPEEKIVDERTLIELARATDRYALDGSNVRSRGRVGMGFQPYHTHERSRLESQPVVDVHGNMLSFDGRLDNQAELRRQLDLPGSKTTDSLIVLTAFYRWGEECFSKFIGDWALALWSQRPRSLYLARDHAGTRTLYFENTDGRILWSTYLETFFADGQSRELHEGYAARYLACQPIGDLTPYKGITSVSPAHYLVFHEGKLTRKLHWHGMGKDRLFYKTDKEYEEHFLFLFRQSVERRTGPGAPILAQLSGGIDSSSIVCMSDHIRKQRVTPGDLLDTVSYYDESEPNWNETPYFTVVEKGRGKRGLHIQTSFQQRTFLPFASSGVRSLLPGFDSSSLIREKNFGAFSKDRGYRVILSGMGGDELLGGVPTPLPELAQLFASFRLWQFLERSVKWCLALRLPLLHVTGSVLKAILEMYGVIPEESPSTPAWTNLTSQGITSPPKRGFGRSPQEIYDDRTWWKITETLPHRHPEMLCRYEYRYPYLDRDLVEFLSQVPRSQLVSPGERRSLMRRSLRGIVPDAILDRKRKAYIIRSPLLRLQEKKSSLRELFLDSQLERRGIISSAPLQKAIEAGSEYSSWPQIMRAIALELWIQDLDAFGFCS